MKISKKKWTFFFLLKNITKTPKELRKAGIIPYLPASSEQMLSYNLSRLMGKLSIPVPILRERLKSFLDSLLI